MDPTRSSGDGSGNSGDYTREIADNDQLHEEIQSMFEQAPENGSSFTALLGLPANQAMELLHLPEPGNSPVIPSAAVEIARPRPGDHKSLPFPFGCPMTFPSSADLVERTARFSAFAFAFAAATAAEDSPQTTSSGPSNSGGRSPKPIKAEPADSDSNPNSSSPGAKPSQRPAKRKGPEKSKAKGAAAKRGKGSSEYGIPKPAEKNKGGSGGGSGEKLPYVHVRARRGQATDSHSLAERARREKINARMKLLQELVPGCSKISGTALVLDEIINHVQSLQRQVEFLSMRLAAVNPKIDFSGLDSFFAAEEGRVTTGNVGSTVGLEAASLWPEVQVDGVRRQQQQIWHVDLLPPRPPPPPQSSSSPSPVWGRGDSHDGFVAPGASLFGYDSVNSVPLQVNQLKTEL